MFNKNKGFSEKFVENTVTDVGTVWWASWLALDYRTRVVSAIYICIVDYVNLKVPLSTQYLRITSFVPVPWYANIMPPLRKVNAKQERHQGKATKFRYSRQSQYDDTTGKVINIPK